MKVTAKSGYDKIAPFYDNMVGLCLGKNIFDAQVHFFKEIPSSANVLILGGGTGWIVKQLFKINHNCKIWYIDSSEKMIEIAIKGTQQYNTVFIHGNENDIPVNVQFDAVITNFYLDCFSHQELTSITDKIKRSLHTNGIWIVTEFVDTGRTRHQFLLWTMHQFFKWVCKHPNTRLVDWQQVFRLKEFDVIKEKSFQDGFIKAVVYFFNRGQTCLI